MNNNPAPASISMAVAAHPWTPQERWDYSRTWQVQVLFGGVNYNVRGHVHYTRARQPGATANGPFVNPAQYNAGPGRYWISGVNNWDAPTLGWVVVRYTNITNIERQNATNNFNGIHPGVGLPLR